MANDLGQSHQMPCPSAPRTATFLKGSPEDLFTLEGHISTLPWGGDSKVFWNVFGWNGHVDSQVGSQGLRLHFL